MPTRMVVASLGKWKAVDRRAKIQKHILTTKPSKEWLLAQPDFTNNCTLYQNKRFFWILSY